MSICNAIIKHGYSNFALKILEYCDKSNLIKREQYYFDIIEPEYNILRIAASTLGFKHSKETLEKMATAKLGKKHSKEILAKMSAAQKAVDRSGKNHPMYGKTHTKETLAKIAATLRGRAKPKGSGCPPQRIEVFNVLTNERIEYDSIKAAALAINIKPSIISKYFINNQKSPYKKLYLFKKL
ncbi:hypothetical protein ABW19_dt0206623 [Dactylella cylindrospora]|nr:hypothetical protein ABW19_dt0206623 [Dactylella cylindrospora]